MPAGVAFFADAAALAGAFASAGWPARLIAAMAARILVRRIMTLPSGYGDRPGAVPCGNEPGTLAPGYGITRSAKCRLRFQRCQRWYSQRDRAAAPAVPVTWLAISP